MQLTASLPCGQEEAKLAREKAKLQASKASLAALGGGAAKELTPAQAAIAKIKEGDTATEEGKLAEALVLYKAALVRSCLHTAIGGAIVLLSSLSPAVILDTCAHRPNLAGSDQSWSRKSKKHVSAGRVRSMHTH